METILKAMHTIDLDNGQVVPKASIPADFEEYIYVLLRYVLNNSNTKAYKIHDNNTQVISCITQVADDHFGAKDNISYEEKSLSIADKLLREEQQAQETIGRTGQNVKRGSLLQAFIRDENQQYYYILAKVEHQEFYDENSLEKSVGFPNDEKKAWKTTVIPMRFENDELLFGVLRVHTDNAAKYWADRFLEIEEEHSDAVNTKMVFDEIDGMLSRQVKKVSPSDHLALRGALITILKTDQEITYTDMVDRLIGDYHPYNTELNIEQLRDNLIKIPETKKFDTNFHTVPDVITARIRRAKYSPMVGVELTIDGGIENIQDAITARCDDRRGNLLEVRCSNEQVFKTFSTHS